MRKTLARVTAAAVTGLFLNGTAAVGQTPPPARPAPAAKQQSPTPYAVAAAPVSAEGPARFTEVAIELAWLTDPVTFACHLAAKATPAGLEVRGFVPSEVVRERALKLARQHSDRPVIDGLQIHGAMAAHVPAAPTDQLRPAVDAAVKTAFPALAHRVTVHHRSYGQVVLTGGVPSLEDKLALSQALRRVPGCRSVVNQLQVGATPAPQMAAAPPRPTTGPVLPQVAGTPGTPAPSRSDFAKAMPAPTRAEFASVGALAAKPELPRPPASLSPYSGPPAATGVKQAAFIGPVKPAETGPAVPKLATWQPAKGTEPKAATGPQQLKTPSASPPLLPVLDRPSERPGQSSGVTFATLGAKQAATVPSPAAPPPAPVKAVPPPAPAPVKTVAQATPPRPVPPPVPAVKPAPPAPVQTAAAAPRPAVPVGEPYVATGVVLIDAEPPAAPASPSAAVNGVRLAVERACAGKARDVEAVSQPDGSLVVRLRAANKADADSCYERVRNLPEVVSYGSRLRLAITVPE